jgi:hypothetical protein
MARLAMHTTFKGGNLFLCRHVKREEEYVVMYVHYVMWDGLDFSQHGRAYATVSVFMAQRGFMGKCQSGTVSHGCLGSYYAAYSPST